MARAPDSELLAAARRERRLTRLLTALLAAVGLSPVLGFVVATALQLAPR